MRAESAKFQMIIKAMQRSVSDADCSTLAEIIRDVRRGDETGWKRMVDECVPVLRDMAQEVLPADVKCSDSEDIAGDVLVKVLGKLPSYAIDESLSELIVGRQAWTYLAKISFSIIRERYLRGRTTKRPQSVEVISVDAQHADPVRQQNSQRGVPETAAWKDEQDLVCLAMEKLSPKLREVIVLFVIEEWPAREVANRLTPDAVAENQQKIADVQEELEAIQAKALRALSPKDKAKLNELENRLVALKRDGGCSAVSSRLARARRKLREILPRMLNEEE